MAGRRGQGRRKPRVAAPKLEGSVRTCVGCRDRFSRASLVRLVRAPDGQVLVDRWLRAPGRGAHLCYERECIELAVKRKAFARAFQWPTQAFEVDELANEIVRGVEARISDTLALARRKRGAISGTEMVERALRSADAHLLVLACDVGADSARRLQGRASVGEVPVVSLGDRALLGRLQGHPERVAIAVTDVDIALNLVLEFERRNRVLVAGR